MILSSYLRFIYLLPLVSQVTSSSEVDYSSNSQAAFVALQSWYNRTSGIWDTTGWWNSANALTTLGDLAATTTNLVEKFHVEEVYANTFIAAQIYQFSLVKSVQDYKPTCHYHPPYPLGIRPPPYSNAKGFLNSYYDDEGWWALAWIQAYDVTHNLEYLDAAVTIFNDMKNGSTTNCGGIWWDKANTYVNAIANELYLSVGAHLANRVKGREQYFLTTAIAQWGWFQQTGMINSQSLINDGITDTCTNNNGTVWSYNQGVILGALVELSAATHNGIYIAIANRIARAAITALTDSNGILHDSCEPDCGADGSQFKGVFVRNLQILQAAAPADDYLKFIAANAKSIWRHDRNDENQLSVVWSGPFVAPANASTQSSALDVLVAAAALEKKLKGI